ncbi:MAG: putative lipid II flippase FtsW [Desulfobacterales bacterium]
MAGPSAAKPLNTYDLKLLLPVLILVGVGIVMVYSASSAVALKKIGTDYYYLKRQAIFTFSGIAVLMLCRHVPYRFYRPTAYILLGGAVLLLAIIQLTGLGVTVGGATRWLNLGGITFQPSELARMALIVYLAYSLSRKADQIQLFSVGFLPHAIVLGVLSALILLQPDFGSVAILCALTWIMMYLAGVRLLHLISPLPLLLPAAWLVMIQESYRLRRLTSFWDPWNYAADEGYQIVHSLMAFGTGGIWGTGIGKGYQKLFYLPEPHTDFIFSVIGEELGLIGVAVILGLYGLILWRGIVIARRAPDAFSGFLAMGITVSFSLQICINMGVSLGLLPTKGLPLPLLSYGGTSLLMSMAAMGILLNISAHCPPPRSSRFFRRSPVAVKSAGTRKPLKSRRRA